MLSIQSSSGRLAFVSSSLAAFILRFSAAAFLFSEWLNSRSRSTLRILLDDDDNDDDDDVNAAVLRFNETISKILS